MRTFRFFDETIIHPDPAEASSEFLTPNDEPTSDWLDWTIFGIGLIAAGLGFAGVIR